MRMSCCAAAVAALVVTSCAMPGGGNATSSARAIVPLPNANFEKAYKITCPPDWGCVAHNDPLSFRYYIDETHPGEGKRSLCFEPTKREPWGKVVQAMHDGPWRGRRVRFSMLVRTENVSFTQAGMGAGVFVFAHAATLVRHDTLVHGTSEWQRLSAEIDVPQDTRVLEVGVALIGTGRVCADDAVLELL